MLNCIGEIMPPWLIVVCATGSGSGAGTGGVVSSVFSSINRTSKRLFT